MMLDTLSVEEGILDTLSGDRKQNFTWVAIRPSSSQNIVDSGKLWLKHYFCYEIAKLFSIFFKNTIIQNQVSGQEK